MATYFFPDNTVLINFALLDRHDVLEWFVRGLGRWTLSVARECQRSAQQPGLSSMVRWGGIFGDALIPNTTELVNARVIAEQMRKPGETHPAQHLGEAETIAIVVNRSLASRGRRILARLASLSRWRDVAGLRACVRPPAVDRVPG